MPPYVARVETRQLARLFSTGGEIIHEENAAASFTKRTRPIDAKR